MHRSGAQTTMNNWPCHHKVFPHYRKVSITQFEDPLSEMLGTRAASNFRFFSHFGISANT
jgi:hypothetical protein